MPTILEPQVITNLGATVTFIPIPEEEINLPNDGRTVIIVRTGPAADNLDVTFLTKGLQIEGKFQPNIVLEVPGPDGEAFIGPFPPELFNLGGATPNTGGPEHIFFSMDPLDDVTIAAIRMK